MGKKLNSVMKFTTVSEVAMKMHLISYISVPIVMQNFLDETTSDLTWYF